MKARKKPSLRDRLINLDPRIVFVAFTLLSVGLTVAVNQYAFGGDPRCLVVKCVVVK